ncbi:MAG: hypothetical protein ACRCXX_07760, partial [Cetobacterium sp.]
LGELLEQIVGVPIGDSTNLTIQQGHVVKKTVGNYYINTDDCKIYKCIKETNSVEFDPECYELYEVAGGSGQPGPAGLSAYDIAVQNGFKGTQVEWVAYLKGEDGTDGKPGINGANGVDGAPGKDGVDGKNGTNGKSAYEIAKAAGTTSATSETQYAQELERVKNIKDNTFFAIWKGTTEEHTASEDTIPVGTVCFIVEADGAITIKEKV